MGTYLPLSRSLYTGFLVLALLALAGATIACGDEEAMQPPVMSQASCDFVEEYKQILIFNTAGDQDIRVTISTGSVPEFDCGATPSLDGTTVFLSDLMNGEIVTFDAMGVGAAFGGVQFTCTAANTDFYQVNTEGRSLENSVCALGWVEAPEGG